MSLLGVRVNTHPSHEDHGPPTKLLLQLANEAGLYLLELPLQSYRDLNHNGLLSTHFHLLQGGPTDNIAPCTQYRASKYRYASLLSPTLLSHFGSHDEELPQTSSDVRVGFQLKQSLARRKNHIMGTKHNALHSGGAQTPLTNERTHAHARTAISWLVS